MGLEHLLSEVKVRRCDVHSIPGARWAKLEHMMLAARDKLRKLQSKPMKPRTDEDKEARDFMASCLEIEDLDYAEEDQALFKEYYDFIAYADEQQQRVLESRLSPTESAIAYLMTPVLGASAFTAGIFALDKWFPVAKTAMESSRFKAADFQSMLKGRNHIRLFLLVYGLASFALNDQLMVSKYMVEKGRVDSSVEAMVGSLNVLDEVSPSALPLSEHSEHLLKMQTFLSTVNAKNHHEKFPEALELKLNADKAEYGGYPTFWPGGKWKVRQPYLENWEMLGFKGRDPFALDRLLVECAFIPTFNSLFLYAFNLPLATMAFGIPLGMAHTLGMGIMSSLAYPACFPNVRVASLERMHDSGDNWMSACLRSFDLALVFFCMPGIASGVAAVTCLDAYSRFNAVLDEFRCRKDVVVDHSRLFKLINWVACTFRASEMSALVSPFRIQSAPFTQEEERALCTITEKVMQSYHSARALTRSGKQEPRLPVEDVSEVLVALDWALTGVNAEHPKAMANWTFPGSYLLTPELRSVVINRVHTYVATARVTQVALGTRLMNGQSYAGVMSDPQIMDMDGLRHLLWRWAVAHADAKANESPLQLLRAIEADVLRWSNASDQETHSLWLQILKDCEKAQEMAARDWMTYHGAGHNERLEPLPATSPFQTLHVLPKSKVTAESVGVQKLDPTFVDYRYWAANYAQRHMERSLHDYGLTPRRAEKFLVLRQRAHQKRKKAGLPDTGSWKQDDGTMVSFQDAMNRSLKATALRGKRRTYGILNRREYFPVGCLSKGFEVSGLEHIEFGPPPPGTKPPPPSSPPPKGK